MQEYLLSGVINILWILAISYALLTLVLKYLWQRIPSFLTQKPNSDFITVVIPVRNEEDNIVHLLSDLNAQSLASDRFEVLVMNDFSTDQTALLVEKCIREFSISIKLITLPDIPTTSPKKRAIETAIGHASGSLIVTTDGDCRVKPGWLQSISNCYQSTGAKLISGPVTFTKESTWTDYLQTVEFASLIGSGASSISAGYPSMCNGANLAYQKQAFMDVGGFDGVRHIASGDDEFLMHKIAHQFPDGIHFLKNQDAIVQTTAHKQWQPFFKQRKRWASKWKHYQSKTPLVLALYIFSCNFSVIVATLLWALDSITPLTFTLLILLKVVPEWLFLGSILSFLQKKSSILYIPLTQLIYPFYVCLFGLVAQKPEYEWKGRKLV